MRKKYISETAKQTEEIGFELAKDLQGGDVICLYGELGAGKTTITQGIARGLGVKSRVISPTFALLKQYESDKSSQNNVKHVYHLDLYRLEDEKSVKSIGIQEIIEDSEGIVIVEWPEKMNPFLPTKHIDIRISEQGDSREIYITRI
jgi:tRNA threonylcarbamoyladenosine biosynthesis protein TsaE